MTFRRRLAASAAALSISMTGSAVFADVTPRQVWEDWQGYFEGLGYAVEAQEAAAGGDLTVTDMVMTMDLPEGEGSATVTLDEVMFRDNGDGTVGVVFPAVMPMQITGRDDEGQEVESTVEVTSDGLVMTVSGAPEDMTYTYAAAELGVALAGLVADGEPVEIGAASVTMANLAGSSRMALGDLRDTTQDMTAGPVTYALDFVDPETGATMVANGGYDSVAFKGEGAIPRADAGADMAAMLEAGFAMDGAFTFAGGASEFSFNEGDDTFEGRTQSRGGRLDVSVSEGALGYAGTAEGMTMEMQGSELPFPVELGMEELGFSFTAPVSESEEPQDFAAAFTLADFTMSEKIWAMFDPGGQLPRDPATVSFDLSGKARMLMDVLDPQEAEDLAEGDEVPAELESLDLNALTVRLAGAELTGEGAFTFDNADLESFGGMPAPEGALNLRLQGGNALLDTLVSMGLVPEDQASGARMMLGLFARPGEGEDVLLSTIEVNEEGHVLANGQRIQ